MEAGLRTQRRTWLAGRRPGLVCAFTVRTRWIGSSRSAAFWASLRRTVSIRQLARCARRISATSSLTFGIEIVPKMDNKSGALDRELVDLGAWRSRKPEGIRGSRILTPRPDKVSRMESVAADECKKTRSSTDRTSPVTVGRRGPSRLGQSPPMKEHVSTQPQKQASHPTVLSHDQALREDLQGFESHPRDPDWDWIPCTEEKLTCTA